MHQHQQALINWAIEHKYKFTDYDLSSSKRAQTLRDIGLEYISSYSGDNSFVNKLKDVGSWRLTCKQVRAALNIMVDEYTSPNLPQIPDGRYTVVLDKELGIEYTFELSDCPEKFGKPDSTQIISMLIGPDNESDYHGVGFVLPGRRFVPWNKTMGMPSVLAAVDVLVKAEDYISHGEQYAIKSGRCWRCHRTLTRSESIVRGLGPTCAKILGITTVYSSQPRQQAVLHTVAGDVVMNVGSDGVAIEEDLF